MRFAPLRVPLKRRMETLVLFFWTTQMFWASVLLAVIAFTPPLWPIALIYFVWMWNDKAPWNGGRPFRWLRAHWIWGHFRDYFPVTIVRASPAPFDTTRKYLFAYHPHGVISFGAFATFACAYHGFDRLFPGLALRLCTLNSNFWFPFLRDFMLSMGLISADRRSIQRSFDIGGPGSCVALVVGGAEEALDARPGTIDLTLARRRGFVRMALRTGSWLVPVIAFGENDVYNQLVANPPGSRARAAQSWFKKIFGFSTPLFSGRGVFNYDFGLLPLRKPIVVVIGDPIPPPGYSPAIPRLLPLDLDAAVAGITAADDSATEEHDPRPVKPSTGPGPDLAAAPSVASLSQCDTAACSPTEVPAQLPESPAAEARPASPPPAPVPGKMRGKAGRRGRPAPGQNKSDSDLSLASVSSLPPGAGSPERPRSPGSPERPRSPAPVAAASPEPPPAEEASRSAAEATTTIMASGAQAVSTAVASVRTARRRRQAGSSSSQGGASEAGGAASRTGGSSGPSDLLIQQYHVLYCEKLLELYDQYKDIYAPNRSLDMRIVR
ncbi:hypothetical protein H696_01279 [Fonticula alba]|uniref:diacylglycerol O-acyltransferase n=1 Tax=Fonticula alba TaxID=691883 RepID=A0A058ZEI6_FONAL|nr:hypothetical protein H696_01279 [Fonticula alba]KCV71867.1 hypothetical protein H696_01279 [Fonticula alba]|eukprot:XP_009493445.1 hypothetical protein H696_01279 [Fonticula alba]